MAVYVDDADLPYRGMLMCHMMADTREELLAMVDKIGIQRKWIQKPNTHREHFDICRTKRAQAVKSGAVEVQTEDIARKMMAKRDKQVDQ